MDKHNVALKQEPENNQNDENINKGPAFGKRHMQAILLFLGVTIETMTRSNLTIAIVAMTDNSTSSNANVPVYNWSNTNVILSSFYWGYPVFQVLAGELSKSYGPRWLLFVAMAANSLATIVVPWAGQYLGANGVMASRIVQGLSQGGILPTCHTMLGRWAPKNERGRMSTFVFSSVYLGAIICLPITGIISKSSFGWPVTFYLIGGCGILWSAAWICFGHNSPASHPSITTEERRYIEVSLSQENDTQVIPTPWKAILTSLHFWAIIIPTLGSGFGVILLQSETPTYLEKAMNYDISSSGYLSSMIAGVALIGVCIYGPLSDFLIEKHYLSRVNTRKLFQVWSCYVPAACSLALSYLDKTQTHLAVAMLTLSSFTGAGLLFGYGINPMDLSPRFSGIILGFANSLSCIAALFAPLSVQFIVNDETDPMQWRWVFIIAALLYTIPTIFFLLFASGDRQWWDDGAEPGKGNATIEVNRKTNFAGNSFEIK